MTFVNQILDMLVTKRSLESLPASEDKFAMGFSEFTRISETTDLFPVPNVSRVLIICRILLSCLLL